MHVSDIFEVAYAADVIAMAVCTESRDKEETVDMFDTNSDVNSAFRASQMNSLEKVKERSSISCLCSLIL